MAAKQNITLRICGKDYPFGVDPADEELYRIAVKRVNDLVNEYAARINNSDYSARDYLALAAYNFARENIRMSQSREVSSEDVKALDEISARIDEYMNRPTGE